MQSPGDGHHLPPLSGRRSFGAGSGWWPGRPLPHYEANPLSQRKPRHRRSRCRRQTCRGDAAMDAPVAPRGRKSRCVFTSSPLLPFLRFSLLGPLLPVDGCISPPSCPFPSMDLLADWTNHSRWFWILIPSYSMCRELYSEANLDFSAPTRLIRLLCYYLFVGNILEIHRYWLCGKKPVKRTESLSCSYILVN